MTSSTVQTEIACASISCANDGPPWSTGPTRTAKSAFAALPELGSFFGAGLGDELDVRGALALEDGAVGERAERRVEDAVRRVHAADVPADKAEQGERVADGHLEGG